MGLSLGLRCCGFRGRRRRRRRYYNPKKGGEMVYDTGGVLFLVNVMYSDCDDGVCGDVVVLVIVFDRCVLCRRQVGEIETESDGALSLLSSACGAYHD